MTIIYDLVASYEEGCNGLLLSKEIEVEGKASEEIQKNFEFWLKWDFAPALAAKANYHYSNVELSEELQEITIEIEAHPYDDNDNCIDEDCSTDYRCYYYHPLIGLFADKKEASQLLAEELKKKIEEEDERKGSQNEKAI